MLTQKWMECLLERWEGAASLPAPCCGSPPLLCRCLGGSYVHLSSALIFCTQQISQNKVVWVRTLLGTAEPATLQVVQGMLEEQNLSFLKQHRDLKYFFKWRLQPVVLSVGWASELALLWVREEDQEDPRALFQSLLCCDTVKARLLSVLLGRIHSL